MANIEPKTTLPENAAEAATPAIDSPPEAVAADVAAPAADVAPEAGTGEALAPAADAAPEAVADEAVAPAADAAPEPGAGEAAEPVPAPEAEAPKTSSHDLPVPAAFVDWMMEDWKAPSTRAPAKVKNAARFRARREALSALFPGETLVIPTGHEKYRSNDTAYAFRPGSEFYYLTGNMEPDCVLVLEPQEDGGHRDVLWVEPNPGKTTPTFFTDRAKGELWVGPRLGVEKSRLRYDVDECRGLPDLAAYLAAVRDAGKPYRVLRGFAPEVDALLPEHAEPDHELAAAIHELRLYKDAAEIREIEEAIAATKNALEGVIASLPDAENERVVEALFDAHARIHGNGVSFATIAASGPDAAILHWTKNDQPIDRNGLLLIDCGVESHGLYSSDVSRTFPVSGKFTKEQRELYDLVMEAQAAAIAAVKPGNDFLAPHRAAMEVFARGLVRLGLLEDAEEALKEENQFYKRFTLHGVSHMLGLDVHDCARARPEKYRQGKLEPGMVLTVEPGLYFQLDDEKVPRKYRGIGIRVEEDVLVTARGCRVLTAEIPNQAEAIEAWMASIWGADEEEEEPKPAPRAKKPAAKAKRAARPATRAAGKPAARPAQKAAPAPRASRKATAPAPKAPARAKPAKPAKPARRGR
jgi:Xaa-Pro aminopeptidase